MNCNLEYKCSRCGDVSKQAPLREITDHKQAFEAMVWIDLHIWNPSELPPDRIMCECKDGGIGIARFVGWSLDVVLETNVNWAEFPLSYWIKAEIVLSNKKNGFFLVYGGRREGSRGPQMGRSGHFQVGAERMSSWGEKR
jgi:hypothetical protein